MDLSKAIVKHGTEAVRRYRTVAGLSQDNEMPEIFLGSYLACAIHDELKVNVHVERRYTVIALELGVTVDTGVVNKIGDYRADVAIYEKQRPVAIVELKVFDDYKRPALIVADRDKMRKLSGLCGIETYLGVFVTDDTSGALCTERVRALGKALDHEFDSVGDKLPSIDGRWDWLFACGRLA
jgi:hypothetical protein